jgi:hypothetical protein
MVVHHDPIHVEYKSTHLIFLMVIIKIIHFTHLGRKD